MGPNTLFQIGRQIPDHVPLPPGIDTFEKVLGSFAVAFEMNHHGGDAGRISYEARGPRNATITSATPYPSDFDHGVIQGFFQKLLSTRAQIRHGERGPCKKNGDASCDHEVTAP